MASVLVVENDAVIRDMLCAALKDASYAAECVGSLAEAARAMVGNGFALIVADILLPDGKGYDLLPTAASLGIPVFLITGDNQELPTIKQMQITCLVKPFSLGQFLDEVKRHTASRP